jgi:hypothetical protein
MTDVMVAGQHFVTFFSPGTFVAEHTTKPVDEWDVPTAQRMAAEVKERHGAVPYAFQFTTRERGEADLDSHETGRSGMYYIGGRILTIEEVRAAADPADRILLRNMECNGWDRVWQTTTGWAWTQPLKDGDVVLAGA